MTEQEFRNALKNSVGHTGLSYERQMKVLARMKGDETKVRNSSNKMKLILVLVAVLALGVTGAVASGLGAVDWFGEEAASYDRRIIGHTEAEARLLELHTSSADDVLSVVYPLNGQTGDIGFMSDMTSDYYASSLEEMQAWVEDDGSLEWLAGIPEGYELKLGRVGYACHADGSFELIKMETTEDGYRVAKFRMPLEHRFMMDYVIRLENKKGDTILIMVRMHHGEGGLIFDVEEGSEVRTLTVADQDNALFIASQTEVQLAMRKQFDKEISYISPDIAWNGKPTQAMGRLGGVTIEVTATDTSLTSDDLLAIFGITAQ